MKKAIAISLIVITFLILYLLQANFFSWFTIAGIKPNLFVLLILFIGLYAGRKVGIICGLIGGFLLEILIGKNVAASMIMLGIVGFLGGYFDKNFSKESRITIMLMVMGSTCLYEIGNYVFSIIQLGNSIEILPFIKTLCIEVIYNTLLTIIVYPGIQKIGYQLEDTFKGQNILTRYF